MLPHGRFCLFLSPWLTCYSQQSFQIFMTQPRKDNYCSNSAPHLILADSTQYIVLSVAVRSFHGKYLFHKYFVKSRLTNGYGDSKGKSFVGMSGLENMPKKLGSSIGCVRFHKSATVTSNKNFSLLKKQEKFGFKKTKNKKTKTMTCSSE